MHSVLHALRDQSSGAQPYHVVSLSGILQPTDRLALREMASQLMQQGAIGEQELSEIPDLDQEPEQDADTEATAGGTFAGANDDDDDDDDAPLAARMLAHEQALAKEGFLEDDIVRARSALTSAVLVRAVTVRG